MFVRDWCWLGYANTFSCIKLSHIWQQMYQFRYSCVGLSGYFIPETKPFQFSGALHLGTNKII